jgi:hypothetical protein
MAEVTERLSAALADRYRIAGLLMRDDLTRPPSCKTPDGLDSHING